MVESSVSRRYVTSPSAKEQEADHTQRLKRQKKYDGKLLVDLGKLAKIAISPVLRKSLAEPEVAFTNPVAHLL